MTVWPGDPDVNNQLVNSIENGDEANVSFIQMSAHTGTHIDAPAHFIQNGKSIEALDMNILLGEAEVVEIDDKVLLINKTVLEGLGKKSWSERVLFKTRNSALQLLEINTFHPDFIAVSPEAAEYLVNYGVKLIGIDYLSIAPFDKVSETHNILLSNNVIVVEGLNLVDVIPGIYDLIALPMLLDGADGAPARVLLIQK